MFLKRLFYKLARPFAGFVGLAIVGVLIANYLENHPEGVAPWIGISLLLAIVVFLSFQISLLKGADRQYLKVSYRVMKSVHFNRIAKRVWLVLFWLNLIFYLWFFLGLGIIIDKLMVSYFLLGFSFLSWLIVAFTLLRIRIIIKVFS